MRSSLWLHDGVLIGASGSIIDTCLWGYVPLVRTSKSRATACGAGNQRPGGEGYLPLCVMTCTRHPCRALGDEGQEPCEDLLDW